MEIIFAIAVLIILCTHSVFLGIIVLKVIKPEPVVETPQYVMTDEESQKFKEADADVVQDAMNTFAMLNQFMTGNDGGYNVEEQ